MNRTSPEGYVTIPEGALDASQITRYCTRMTNESYIPSTASMIPALIWQFLQTAWVFVAPILIGVAVARSL